MNEEQNQVENRGGSHPGNKKRDLTEREITVLLGIHAYKKKFNRIASQRDLARFTNINFGNITPCIINLRKFGYVTPKGKYELNLKGRRKVKEILQSMSCCPMCGRSNDS